LVKKGLLEIEGLDQGGREEAEKALSEIFEVNPVVVRIRLGVLFPPASAGQLAL